MRTCLHCGKDITGYFGKKFCNWICKGRYASHNRTVERLKNPRKFYCKQCGKELIGLHCRSQFCNSECNDKYLIEKHNVAYDGQEYVTCAICGFKAYDLNAHVTGRHKMIVSDYKETYNIATLKAPHVLKELSKRLSGDKNPAYKHGGKFSPYSKKFVGYDTLTEEEKVNKITNLFNKRSEKVALGHSATNQVGYWTDRGNTKEEAIKLVSKRQSTFSLEKCIERYGEEAGKQRWKDRQDKWLSNYKKQNFSEVSQRLFWQLYESIKGKYDQIYFAQLYNGIKDETGKNHEYKFDYGDSFCKLDFYIKDINKVIEFDGDYWHGVKRGNQQRDNLREQKILSTGIQVYHVQERNFKKDPIKVIKECLEFING